MPGLTYAKDYQPIIYEWFMHSVDAVPSLRTEIFDVQTVSDLSTYSLGVGGMPVEQWDTYRKTGRAGYVEPERGYPKTFTLVEYPVRLPIKKLYLQTDKIGLVQQAVNDVAISAAQKMDLDAGSVFNNAFSSSYLGPDGVALCSASHPWGPDNTGTTRDNTGATAFSYTAVKDTRVDMRQWNDGQGNPLYVRGRLALLPITLEDQAVEIFTARGKPGTADNDGNATQGFDYRIWDALDDTNNNWFLLDPIKTKQYLKWYNFGGFETMVVEETTTDIVYEFKMTYVFGWRHWSFVFGHDLS